MNPLVAFFRELVRRRVLQAVIVYGGVGFVLLEAAGNLTDALGLPAGLQRLVAVAVLVGFPVVAVLAWMYQRTPDGIRRAEPSELGTGLRPAFVGSLVVVTALLGLGLIYWLRTPEPGPNESTTEMPGPLPERDPVLAVLPFEYLGDPVAAGDLAAALEARVETALAQSEGLTLRSRGALTPLLDRGVPVDSVAHRLDIDYFVRAQVVRDDATPRVVVQLVDGMSQEVLGSATVEAEAEGLLALSEELASRMEDVLRPTLGSHVRMRTWQAQMTDSVAYRLLLQAHTRRQAALGIALGDAAPAEDQLRELQAADSLLALAMERAPEWKELPLARARIAATLTVVLRYLGADDAMAAAFARGRECVRRVLEADPDNAEALALRGRLRWRAAFLSEGHGEEALADSAERDLWRALELDPENPEAASTLADLLQAKQRWEQAYHYGRLAYRLDSYQDDWQTIINRVALSAYEMGQDSIAAEWCREGLARTPDSPMHHDCSLRILAWGDATPDPAGAWRHYETITRYTPAPEGGLHPFYGFLVAGALARAGLPDSARTVLRRTRESLGPDPPSQALWLEAGVRFRLGEAEEARSLLRQLMRRDPEEAATATSTRVLREYLEEGLQPLRG